MATYRVSSDSLQSTATQISGARTRIMDQISAVRGQVEATRDSWEGSAQGEYDGLMQRWRIAADGVQEALNDTVTALQRAATEYDQTEQAQVQRFTA